MLSGGAMTLSKTVTVLSLALSGALLLGCSDSGSNSASFSQVHQLLVTNCTGDGTCHGAGTDAGMYPHPEFANPDEAISKGYVDSKIDTLLTRINSTVLDPTAFGTRRMPPSDYDPEGLTDAEKAMIQAYADTVAR